MVAALALFSPNYFYGSNQETSKHRGTQHPTALQTGNSVCGCICVPRITQKKNSHIKSSPTQQQRFNHVIKFVFKGE